MKDGGPAFPFAAVYVEDGERTTSGMTLRDYFAAAALPAMMGASSDPKQAAFWAYELADAMLAERDKS